MGASVRVSSLERAKEARRLADVVHGRLVEIGRTVAVAESLTGGLVGAHLTDAAGTSVTFRGGLIVYSAESKHAVAGVPQRLLDQHGPVSAVIARELARGARERLGADYGIGVTGVAGPATQDGSPVGEVHVAVAGADVLRCDIYRFDGSRDAIRLATVAAALRQLVGVVESDLARATCSS